MIERESIGCIKNIEAKYRSYLHMPDANSLHFMHGKGQTVERSATSNLCCANLQAADPLNNFQQTLN